MIQKKREQSIDIGQNEAVLPLIPPLPPSGTLYYMDVVYKDNKDNKDGQLFKRRPRINVEPSLNLNSWDDDDAAAGDDSDDRLNQLTQSLNELSTISSDLQKRADENDSADWHRRREMLDVQSRLLALETKVSALIDAMSVGFHQR